MNEAIGTWAFILGVLIAVIAGFIPVPYVTWILVILGLAVGFLNITGKEATPFLVAAIALIVGANALGAQIGGTLGEILKNVVALVVPAAIVVALKAVYGLAKSK